MSGSVYFEGNAFIDGGHIQNVNISTCNISNSAITTTSIDMLSSSGQLQHITNVKDPIQPQDAATKKYVDAKGLILEQIILINTAETSVSVNNDIGSFIVTITPFDSIGPSSIFNITKNDKTKQPHIVRISASPGLTGNVNNPYVMLNVSWAPNTTVIKISKTGNLFNGNYTVKVI